ncbi:hypothetical protein E2C01_045511 [Portunus trituberculatus]|uniref:Uncharacterized protein n=1 Tax=Portunus trituberculatus TaxID=210409 RepID=A0A5B7G297_PORTR|nr:hypothetical protein [Portunus trituberculatus]
MKLNSGDSRGGGLSYQMVTPQTTRWGLETRPQRRRPGLGVPCDGLSHKCLCHITEIPGVPETRQSPPGTACGGLRTTWG